MEYILWDRPIYITVILILIYSFLGWVGEVLYAYYKRGHFVNRGFLYGPFCPIYGVSITAIVTALKPLDKSILLLFLGSVLITTLAEYITSSILERFFDSKWWDYSNRKFNLKGRICLSFSLLWGIAGVAMYKIVNPRILYLLYAIPKKAVLYAAYIGLAVFILDMLLTLISLAGLRSHMMKFQDIAQRAKSFTGSKFERIVRMKEFLESYADLEIKLRFNHRRLLESFPDFKRNRFGKLIKELKNEIDKFREN